MSWIPCDDIVYEYETVFSCSAAAVQLFCCSLIVVLHTIIVIIIIIVFSHLKESIV